MNHKPPKRKLTRLQNAILWVLEECGEADLRGLLNETVAVETSPEAVNWQRDLIELIELGAVRIAVETSNQPLRLLDLSIEEAKNIMESASGRWHLDPNHGWMLDASWDGRLYAVTRLAEHEI